MIYPVERLHRPGVQDQISDEELVLACRKGDGNAWSLLVTRYQRLIYTIARRSRLDEDQSAEVFQNTFTSLYEHLDAIEQPDRIRAWLVTTARRETLRLIRRQHGELSFSDTDSPGDERGDEWLPDNSPLLNEELERIEEQHLIRLALAAIDGRCRRLITLLFYQPVPVPYAEAARVLGMPASSIGPTRARCLDKLRRALSNLFADVFS
jgi:RNA polymerase sigma factor (sigma-70 family)